MRPRFVALLPHGDRSLGDAWRNRVRTILPIERCSGANILYTCEETPVVDMPRARGWLIGTAFDGGDQKRVLSFRASQDMAVESTGGRHLLRSVWGSYAAIWQSRDHHHVFREPSGALPIFLARLGDLTAVTSDVGLMVRSGLIRPEIDWEMVEHGLLYPQLPTRRTHLKAVFEVLPATRVTVDRETMDEQLLWQPWSFAVPAPKLTASLADRNRLAATIDQSVAAWAQTCQKAHLELSGGLDSSIVAMALAPTGKLVSCANLVTPGMDGDERDYAQCVADKVGAALDILQTAPDVADPIATLSRRTPRPRGMRIMAGIDAMFAAAARKGQADAIFSGGGGDNVFCFTTGTAPIFDALGALGFGAARTVVANTARLTGTTEGEVLWHAAKRWFVDRLGRRWQPDRAFLARQVSRAAQSHPWLSLPRGTRAGTRAHIAAIIRIHDILDAHQRAADQTMIFPLMSQPVLETCLSIPSWHWSEGGRDRAVARDAFADRLPARVLRRSNKGVLNSLLLPAFEQARPDMRALLCDGLLARRGLLDRGKIADALSRPISERPDIYGRILVLVDAELWVNSVVSFGESAALDR